MPKGEASAENGKRGIALRAGVEALRRLGYEIPREQREGARGQAPYAASAKMAIARGWLSPDGDVLVGPLVDAERVDDVAPTAKKPKAMDPQTALEYVGRVDLSSVVGRLTLRTKVVELVLMNTIDPKCADTIGALAKAQANEANGDAAKIRPRVRFLVPTTRDEARAMLEAKAEQEAAS